MIHCSIIQDIPHFISSSLVNINELIAISKLQLRPFCPSSPAISLLPAELENGCNNSQKSTKCPLLGQRSRSRSLSQANSSSFNFTLVPFAYAKQISLQNLAGFLLIPKYQTESPKHYTSNKSKRNNVSPSRSKVRERHRTSSTSSDITKVGICI